MNTKTITKLLIIIACFVAGFWLGKGDKEVIREIVEVEVTKEVVRTETIIVEKPGGEKTTIIRQVRETDTRKDSKTKETITAILDKYMISIGSNIGRSPRVYSASIQKRFFGGIHAGIYGRSDREFGVLVSLSF